MTDRTSRASRRGAFGAATLALLLITAVPQPLGAQADSGVHVLLVVAHPDDDAMFAGAVYKITRFLGGQVDVALVTDGSGGYRYSQLAEPIYGLQLTDERVARQHLPAIRKRELMAGGAIVGIRNYFFLEEADPAYTENVDTVLTHVWRSDRVQTRLQEILERGRYDYVFVHLPIPNFHAHHKAASILALRAAQAVAAEHRPTVMGCFIGTKADTTMLAFDELPGYPITRVQPGLAPFVFDMTEPLDPQGRLDYRIVVNWLIAEHKSQGTMQLLVNRGEVERFWYFEVNGPQRLASTRVFFERLAVPALPERTGTRR